jgi:hypothetical protein
MTKMANNSVPDQAKKKLLVALAIASIAAALIAFFQILPAKYGIDPTGFGAYVGLMKRYEAQEYYKRLRNTTEKQERVNIELPAGNELEYKLYMREGDRVEYRWSTEEVEVFFDFHGEPEAAHSAGFESYSSDTSSEKSGTFTAPFEGTHGWYWRNDGETPLTIVLETRGKYSNVGLKAAAFSR